MKNSFGHLLSTGQRGIRTPTRDTYVIREVACITWTEGDVAGEHVPGAAELVVHGVEGLERLPLGRPHEHETGDRGGKTKKANVRTDRNKAHTHTDRIFLKIAVLQKTLKIPAERHKAGRRRHVNVCRNLARAGLIVVTGVMTAPRRGDTIDGRMMATIASSYFSPHLSPWRAQPSAACK